MMKNWKTISGVFILLLLLGGVVYLNTFEAGFHWDDIVRVRDNRSIYQWKDLGQVFRYWPTRFFLFWTFALNYRLGGLNVFGYHLVNILIHFFSAFLVYLIFFRLRREKEGVDSIPSPRFQRMALFAALIFLIHPLQTQSVTYIIQRGASLSGFFCLLALFLYIQARRKESWLAWGGAWLAGLLGIYSKEGAAALPILLLLWEFIFGPRHPLGRKLRMWLPFALLPVIIFATIWWGVESGASGIYYQTNIRIQPTVMEVGGNSPPISSRLVYFFTQLNVARTYIRLLILPVRQSIYHDYPVFTSLFQGPTIFSALLLSSLLLIAGRLLKPLRIAAFGIFFFFIALLPTSSVFLLWPLISEHHLYLSLAGFAWSLSCILATLTSRLNSRVGMVMGGIIILCLSLLTHSRNLVWLNPFDLWSDALSKAPQLGSLHAYMAGCYIERGQYELAIEECKTAFRLNPDFDAYQNLWAAYHLLKRYDKAEEIARERLEKCPQLPQAHLCLARTLFELNRRWEAEQELRRALELPPELSRAHLLLGRIYFDRKEYREAREHIRKALEINPHLNAARIELKKVNEKFKQR